MQLFEDELSVSCQRELGWYKPSNTVSCLSTSAKLMDLLDVQRIPLNEYDFKTIAFKKEFDRLIQNPTVKRYLHDLNSVLDSLQHGEKHLNLWEWTLDREDVGKNQVVALRWLAILFQDNRTNGHLSEKDEHTKTLYEVSNKLEELGKKERITFYPGKMENLNQRMDHFYVPAYAAYKLTKDGISPKMSFVTSYLFNRTYEIKAHNLQKSKGSTVLVGLSPLRTRIPKSMKTNKSALEDTYLGYAGALFGLAIAQKYEQERIETFDQFVPKIRSSASNQTKETVQEIESFGKSAK